METTTNGQPKTPLTRQELREQRRLVEAKIELARLEQSQKLLEGLNPFWDGFGGSDLWYDRFKDPQGTYFLPLSVPSDRRHGADWPIFRNEQDLWQFRQAGRLVCAMNSYARGAVKNLRNYIVGKGFTYKAVALDLDPDEAKPLDGAAPSTDVDKVIRKTKAFIARWRKYNRWPRREREGFVRTRRDGEFFIRIFAEDDGMSCVRFLHPERIVNPPGAKPEDGWSFGIKHQMEPFEDIETPVAYNLAYYEGDTLKHEEVDAAEVVHFKINVDDDVARGLTDFTFGTLEAFQRAEKLQRCISVGSAIRAGTAEYWQHQTGTQQQIAALGQGASFQTTVDPRTGNSEQVDMRRPGGIRRFPANVQPVWPPGVVGTGEQISACQADLRAGLTTWCAPEYFSGDASNADYSSTKEAGAPFVKEGECEQEDYKEAYLEVLLRAIQIAVDAGLLPKNTLDVIEVQVEGPAVLHKEPLDTAQGNQIYVGLKAKSPQTVSAELGLDPEQEQLNIEEFEERFGAAGTPLQLPGENGTPPTTPPDPEDESSIFPAKFPESLIECGGEGGEPGPCPTGDHDDSPAKTHPHMAHLLNGAKVHSTGHSKTGAKEKVMELRSQGVNAVAFKDPKGPRGKQFLVAVSAGYKGGVREGRGGAGNQPAPFRESVGADGPVILDVPDVRQLDHFSCGAAATMCVGRFFGVGPDTLDEWKHALGTGEDGTNPQAIIDYLRSLGLTVTAQAGMDRADLQAYTRAGCPVICPVQDYGPEVPDERSFDSGHYLTVIGVALGFIFVQDSSADNVIGDSGSAQMPGRVIISEPDWDSLWHDEGADGRQYVRYGIAVGRNA